MVDRFDIGGTYEQFMVNSKLNHVLHNNLYDSTSTTRTSFINSVYLANTERAINDAFTKITLNTEHATLPVLADQERFNILLQEYVYTPVTSLFGVDRLPSIEMHIADTPIPRTYMDTLIVFLSNLMAMVIRQINTNCATIPQAASTNCVHYKVRDIALMNNIAKQIEMSLQESLAADMAPSFQQYLSRIYPYFVSDVFQDVGLSKAELNIFFTVFTPMFMMLYLTYHIPSRTIRSATSQERKLDVRRKCIMNIYKIYMYTLYACYRKSLMTSPSSAATSRIQGILDSFVNDVFQPEFNAGGVFSESLRDEVTDSNKNAQTALTIEQQTREIEMMRSQTVNVISNQAELERELRTVNAWRWIWFTVLILYLVLAIATIFWFEKLWRGFALTTALMTATLFIMYIVVLSRTMT